MSIVVIGADSVALAHAVQYAGLNLPVTFATWNADLETRLRQGACPLESNFSEEPELEERLAFVRARIHWAPLRDAAVGARVMQFFLPPPGSAEDGHDLIEDVLRASARQLERETLVILECRLAVGDTRERVATWLEQASGRSVGTDFHLAHAVPRTTRGHVFADMVRSPKVFGTLDSRSQEKACEFYLLTHGQALTPTTNLETSELIGLTEHACREVAAAFTHELADLTLRHGLSLDEVVWLANMQPFYPAHRAGLHGVPDEIRSSAILLERSGLTLAAAARRINDEVAERMANRLEEMLGEDLSDTRAHLLLPSPHEERRNARVTAFLEHLRARGVRVTSACSPTVHPEDAHALRVLVVARDDLSVHHLHFEKYPSIDILLDLTNTLQREPLKARGIRYLGIGIPADEWDSRP